MKKILTIILDGFGIRKDEYGNATVAANMQTFNNLWHTYPHSVLEASEEAVGLLKGQAGNSEVGHMTIGAGRMLKQNEIIVNEFLENPNIESKNLARLLKNKEKDVHIMGLCSDGNIHAGVDDFINMYKLLVNNGFTKIHFHLITDGRDTGTHDAMKYINMIKNVISEFGIGDIVSVCGRYYAMDRDLNYDRTKVYYDLVTSGKGLNALSIERAIQQNYDNDITDEFIKPIITSNNIIKNGDILIWMNYRADRSKQLLNAIVNSNTFDEFRVKDLSNVEVYTFFEVDKKIITYSLIEHMKYKNTLGLYLSELKFTQARIAESEKFAHVTYFFDGGYDGKISGCDKINIPSPDVATYDLKPEMSAVEVTKKAIQAMNTDYDFILVNYANADMLGHTGNMEAATDACIAIDMCLSRILEKAEENFYKVIILSDHGNVEVMLNFDGSPCTTHTITPVPFIICDDKIKLKETGSLVNVAPTILDYMDIAIPNEMEGTESLLIHE